MKIVSYNIWNHDFNYNKRMDLLINVLKQEEIDILALQEVRDEKIVKRILKECQFKYYFWKQYFDCHEGLAILSRHPIKDTWTNWDDTKDVHNSFYMHAIVNINELMIGITNVHLDYKRSYYRELEIVKATRKIETSQNNDYNFILGDFNSYSDSIIHQFLTGRQSLLNESTYWIDLGEAYSIMEDSKPEVTIDFYNNPRWDQEYALDLPGRFDWILLKSPYPKQSPILEEFKILGNKRVDGITPSDHYGVLCNLKLDGGNI